MMAAWASFVKAPCFEPTIVMSPVIRLESAAKEGEGEALVHGEEHVKADPHACKQQGFAGYGRQGMGCNYNVSKGGEQNKRPRCRGTHPPTHPRPPPLFLPPACHTH